MIHKKKKGEGEKKYDRRENIYEKKERENIREENERKSFNGYI